MSWDGFQEFTFKVFPQILMKVKVVSDSLQPHGPVACQIPLSMGFSRQEYWSALPCPPPRDLPVPGIEPWSPALQANFYHWSHHGSQILMLIYF